MHEGVVMWKEVIDNPNYLVSDDGRILSKKREVTNRWGGTHTRKESILSQHVGKSGAAVWLYYGSKKKKKYVHRLMLESFVGPCPEGMECCHNDGDCYNNVISNLRWDTHKNNMIDKRIHGKSKGELHAKAKLKESDVIEIRNLYSEIKITYTELGRMFNVSKHTIGDAIRRKTWSHI